MSAVRLCSAVRWTRAPSGARRSFESDMEKRWPPILAAFLWLARGACQPVARDFARFHPFLGVFTPLLRCSHLTFSRPTPSTHPPQCPLARVCAQSIAKGLASHTPSRPLPKAPNVTDVACGPYGSPFPSQVTPLHQNDGGGWERSGKVPNLPRQAVDLAPRRSDRQDRP